jgi:pimeloyl-ACP methyl ester carboxylesterase
MGMITTRDGTEIFYKDWGTGQPVVFSHGWPLNADAWDDQAFLVASNRFRAIAHDRRGHGRSSQPWTGNEMDTYADDLAELIETLDLADTILVGHSTGGAVDVAVDVSADAAHCGGATSEGCGATWRRVAGACPLGGSQSWMAIRGLPSAAARRRVSSLA